MSLPDSQSISNRIEKKGENFTPKRRFKNNKKSWCFMTLLLLTGTSLFPKGFTRALALAAPSSLQLTRVAFVSSTTALALVFPRSTTTPSWSASASTASSLSSTSTDSSCDATHSMPTGYLNAANAAALDDELMSIPGYCLEQLMELAGLAVAEAVYQGIPPAHAIKRKILLICGPGNNGGDGLVAARHLFFFNHYDCSIVYPKRSSNQHFVNLVRQCEDVGIPFLNEMPSADELKEYDAIVDSIFGFSFKGEPREPFAAIMKQMIEAQQNIDNLQVISVDVPSGWNVDEGDVAKTGFVPDMLVSLTTPKMCSKEFRGRHFIGGRFLPPAIAAKYNVQMPPYPGTSQVMEVTREQIEGESQAENKRSQADGTPAAGDESWREEYEAYLAEMYASEQAVADTSFAALTTKDKDAVSEENTADESWEMQYANYCGEKETVLAQEDTKKAEEESWLIQYAKHCAEKEAQLAQEDANYKKLLRKQHS